jgi:hypothetical protein
MRQSLKEIARTSHAAGNLLLTVKNYLVTLVVSTAAAAKKAHQARPFL